MEFIKQARDDWNSIKEQEELKILHKHGNIARRFTTFWICEQLSQITKYIERYNYKIKNKIFNFYSIHIHRIVITYNGIFFA